VDSDDDFKPAASQVHREGVWEIFDGVWEIIEGVWEILEGLWEIFEGSCKCTC
jgi:hypothetical protein